MVKQKLSIFVDFSEIFKINIEKVAPKDYF